MRRNRFWHYENAVLAMLGMTFGLMFFDRMAIIYLMPFVVPDLGLSNTEVGMVTSALALTWAAAGYFISAHSDRSGNRKGILVLTVIAFSLCTMLSGAVTSFILLLLVRAVMGAVEGPVLPIAQSIMAQESSPLRRGFNMGVLQAVVGSILAVILGPVIAVKLAGAVGWRHAMYIMGVPGLIMAWVLARYLWPPAVQPAPSREMWGEEGAGHFTFRDLFRYRNVWLGVIIASGMMSWLYTLMSFAPLYLVKNRGLSADEMGAAMAAMGVGSLLWGIVVPMLSDRVGRKPVAIVFCLLSAMAPLFTLFLPLSVPGPVLSVALAIGFAGSGCFPLVMATIPSETVPVRYVATALGLIMGLGEVIGSVAAPTLAGAAADAAGLAMPLYVSAGSAIMAGVLSLFFAETAPSKVGARAAAPG